MTTDLKMLAWTTGLVGLMWIPYMLARIKVSGLMPTLTYTADFDPLPDWATRAKRAHINSIENLAPFAALAIVAHLTQNANATTALCAVIYFWARVAHYVSHLSGLPFLRTIAFAIAWAAMMAIFLQIVT